MMWVKKYQPHTLDGVVGNKEALIQLKKAIEQKKAVLLYGPTGVGKTCSVEAIAKEMDSDLIEMNASDIRTKEKIEEKMVQAAQQQSLFMRPKILLIDEADGLASSGVTTVVNLIKKSKFPVVITANDPWSLPALKNACVNIELRNPTIFEIRAFLKKIAEAENIEIEDVLLKEISSLSGRDVRAAINDFENLAKGKKKITADDIQSIGYRDREMVIFDSLKVIFKTMNPENARKAFDGVDVDPDMFMLWVEENIPYEYEDLDDIARAYDAISRADVFAGRIHRRQDWGLMKYQLERMTVGVALAKKEMYRKFTRYFFPKYIKLMSASRGARNMRDTILDKIGSHCHCSRSKAEQFLPLVKQIGKELDWLEEEDVKVIKKL